MTKWFRFTSRNAVSNPKNRVFRKLQLHFIRFEISSLLSSSLQPLFTIKGLSFKYLSFRSNNELGTLKNIHLVISNFKYDQVFQIHNYENIHSFFPFFIFLNHKLNESATKLDESHSLHYEAATL